MTYLERINRWNQLKEEAERELDEIVEHAKEVAKVYKAAGLPGTINGFVEMDLTTYVEDISINEKTITFSGNVYCRGCTDRGSFTVPRELLECSADEVGQKINDIVEAKKAEEARLRLHNKEARKRQREARAKRKEEEERETYERLRRKFGEVE